MPIYPYPHTWSTQHSTPPQRHVALRSQTEHQSLQSSNYKSIDYSYSTHENSTKTQRMRNLHNTSHYYSSNSTSQHTCLKPNLTPKISLSRSKNHFNKLDLKPKKKNRFLLFFHEMGFELEEGFDLDLDLLWDLNWNAAESVPVRHSFGKSVLVQWRFERRPR